MRQPVSGTLASACMLRVMGCMCMFDVLSWWVVSRPPCVACVYIHLWHRSSHRCWRRPPSRCLVLRGEQMLGSRPRSECPAYPGWCCRSHGVRVAGQRRHPQSPTRDGAGVRGAARGRRSVPWARVRPYFDCTRSLLRGQTDEVGTHLCTHVRERFARSCTSSQGVEINPASRPISSSTHTISNWSGVTVNTHTRSWSCFGCND